jgi:hypothetical protein
MCVAAALVLSSAPAQAWVESEVRSHVATIDIDRAGQAVVTQDQSLAVRGGPLPGLDISGVDLDAEPLPDATVSSASGSKIQLPPTPLLLEKRDDGSLRIEIDRDRGLRTGVYLFHFQYRTNLIKRDLIRREGNEAEVRWIGPRFNQGIDSARALFRVPAGPTPPTLPSSDSSAGRIDDADGSGGVFIGNLQRLADKDELDIVRPHVSRGEPVLWRIRTSAKVFDAFASPVVATSLASPRASARALSVGDATGPRRRLTWWLGAALGALAYSFAVAGKWRIFSKLCARGAAIPKALIPLPIGPRAAVSGSALAAGFISAAWFDQATLGALFLIAAMALSVHFAEPVKGVLRGPGQWLVLSDAEAFARPIDTAPGRWADVACWRGSLVFALACIGVCVAASVLFASAPYQALLLLLGSPGLLPLFFTGGRAQLPADPATAPRAVLALLAEKLRRNTGIRVVPWARIPEGLREPDELRLLVQVQGAVRGLSGLEVGVEYTAGVHGPRAALFVLVRAREHSPAVRALPRNVLWTRGRNAEERAAVLRPRLPTPFECAALLLELSTLLCDDESRPEHRGARVDGRKPPVPKHVTSPAHVL